MVSKAIVEASGGTIDFFSLGVGHGCAFFFSMQMTEVSEMAEQQLSTMPSTKQTKVLNSRGKKDQAKSSDVSKSGYPRDSFDLSQQPIMLRDLIASPAVATLSFGKMPNLCE